MSTVVSPWLVDYRILRKAHRLVFAAGKPEVRDCPIVALLLVVCVAAQCQACAPLWADAGGCVSGCGCIFVVSMCA